MRVNCFNHKCKFFGLTGCKLESITIGTSGMCREADYEDR